VIDPNGISLEAVSHETKQTLVWLLVRQHFCDKLTTFLLLSAPFCITLKILRLQQDFQTQAITGAYVQRQKGISEMALGSEPRLGRFY
jgi:hypothetical protein